MIQSFFVTVVNLDVVGQSFKGSLRVCPLNLLVHPFALAVNSYLHVPRCICVHKCLFSHASLAISHENE